ncbi:hypothetical protein F2Q69_00000718 [Brassica cretica]|uniref:Uncharacterized protein n=1 Tax=Brassica cretica TaxID=69181 RepID=A0A8S9P3U2_BRACR|nr:hypothetical protein F2Q69_00000718 [Brassica cretica]
MMARLFLAAKKQQRRRVKTAVKHCHNGRISPEGEEDVKMMSAGSKLMSLEDIDEFSAAEFMHRISNSKSKKPKLETIAEEESVLNGLEIKQLLELDFFNAFLILVIVLVCSVIENEHSVTRLKENCCILKITTVAAGIDWNMNLLQPLVKL